MNSARLWNCGNLFAIAVLCTLVSTGPAAAQSAREICFKGMGDKKIAACSEAIRQDPRNSIYYFNRGNAWDDKGNKDKAIADYDEAIRLDPLYASAHYNRGNVWFDKGDRDKAIADYSQAIRLDPLHASAHFNRGNMWSDKGEKDQAIADYSEAIRLNPKHANAHYNRARAWEYKNSLQEALRDFKRYNELVPSDADGLKSISRVEAKIQAQQNQADNQAVDQASSKQQLAAVQPAQPALAGVNQERRVALVIGNTKYLYAPALSNPVNDAQLLSATLRSAGFQSVTMKTDLTREQTIQSLREFAGISDSADWAVVYYSGHGIEFAGINYMIPVDAQLKADRDIDLEAVDVGKVLSSIEGAKRLRLVILDACRDNPFASQMRRTMASRSVGRGLARMEPEAGTLVVYAAKHGETALDGDGRNSPFVQALAQRIQERPPQEIRRLFDLVRDDVMETTHKRQQPFSYGSLSGREDFYFLR